MGYTLKHSIEKTAEIINNLDINQFNSDRRNYYIEKVEFVNEGIFPSIRFTIRNGQTGIIDERCDMLRKVPNTNEVEYRDETVKMYDGIIMNHENYYDICDSAQKIYDKNPAFFPENNIRNNAKTKMREFNVIGNEFNALFYYEYIMYLIGKNL